jgi:hypothetical protein
MSLKRLRWWVTDHWKGYDWLELKRLWWRVMDHYKATLMWIKRYYYPLLLLNYRRYYYPLLDAIKVCHEGRSIHTQRSQIMGSKEPEPWSPRWMRQKHREANNGLSSNDPNYDEKSLSDAETPLCKCDIDCQSHTTLVCDTYGMRYWSCPLPTSSFNWGWDEEKPQKVVSVVAFTL